MWLNADSNYSTAKELTNRLRIFTIRDFKLEVLLDLVDCLYHHNHGLTVTGNFSMQELVERERMHPAIVRRLDDMCTAIEL